MLWSGTDSDPAGRLCFRWSTSEWGIIQEQSAQTGHMYDPATNRQLGPANSWVSGIIYSADEIMARLLPS